jgi:hypothetical protein
MAAKTITTLATAILLGAISMPVMGQAAGNGGGAPQASQPGQGQGQQGGRRFDPAQMRQRMLDNLKEQLGASDDEFAALQPKIEKVMTAERNLNAGRMRMFRGRRGGNNNQDNQQATSPVETKAKDLQDTLDNKDAKPDDIKAKLDALRDAKSKAKDELTGAQKDLKDVLTLRQEAVLVEMGLLD